MLINNIQYFVFFIRYGGKVLLIFSFSPKLEKNKHYEDIILLSKDGKKNKYFEILAFESINLVHYNVSNITFHFYY